MRKPKQVLVFLYRKNKNNEYEYCIFYRNKNKFWQALSGGVEDNESLIDTVKREVFEETGIKVNNILELSSISTIPVVNITGEFTWGDDVYVVTEYTFGVLVENEDIKLSSEHKKYEWLSYNEAYNKLKYDSNKTALWELNYRLMEEKNMNKYLDNLNDEIKNYFKILSPEFPEWLLEYIDTPEMERIGKISLSCGTDYSKCFNIRYWYSNLDHSVGVALIIWHFTHDKKQTLAGLFHDIATPTFKHCIDFMNGDSETQESTEERTTQIIKNSKKIMELLKRDNIKLEEVNDYHIYPIADNDTPKLSADRFEYTFSSGLTFHRVWELDKIKKIYDNVVIAKNEEGIEELVFKDKKTCEEYIDVISNLWPEWVSDKDRTVMQFIADMCKSMNNKGYLTIDDLYTLSEKEVIEKILNCDDTYLKECFIKFQNATEVYKSDSYVEDKYCINVKGKPRYIIPLVLTKNGTIRINKISDTACKKIKNYIDMPKGGYYTYFDFDFKPYN